MIETARLILREFTTDDAAFALRLLNERSFIDNIGDRGVRDLPGAVKYLESGPMTMYAKHGLGLMGVVLKETQQLIGMCGLIKRDGQSEIDVGYAFLPEHWSKGYAREAVAACLDFGRRDLGLKRIAAFVSPGNEPSVRLLEKFGFSHVGRAQLTPGAPEALVYLRTW